MREGGLDGTARARDEQATASFGRGKQRNSAMEPTMPGPTVWMIAFGALAAAIVVLVLLLRGRSRRAERAATRGQRISVIETREIDEERRLVIVRCDGAEHLLLVGGGADILVKADLPRTEPRVAFPAPEQASAGARPADRVPAPAPAPDRYAMPQPPLAGRPEPELVPEPPRTVQAFAPARTAPQAAGSDLGNETQEAIARAESPGAAPQDPDFTEMTRKLEEALKRTAAVRPPSQGEPRIEPVVAAPPAMPAGKPADPFEDEIRRLLGREPGRG